MVAGHAAEVVTGKTWEELLREKILEPIGMNETTAFVDEALATGNFARPLVLLLCV